VSNQPNYSSIIVLILARPNHIITFIRKDHQPPTWATFRVPLKFSKFDIRDYLYHLYNVEVKGVRSWVKQLPLQRKEFGARQTYRPQPQKFMTVELVKPFVWPEVPEDTENWNKKLWEGREKSREEADAAQKAKMTGEIELKSTLKQSEDRQALARKAAQLISGELKWENGAKLDEKWEK
jgi:large subunit ribosomal protein L23